ncbi:hypothetical protein K435DRAFT_62420 [Dendrothele bispora CBS 962.96]|uniref:Uncharacterized protein n=1 Tax=Dendrothele bispora (strain CBS 962.96) TaxID=1314807 RepID=A0A4S8MTA3_DENBC|nr:hypothetical protein K435DRAFT_132234 [Dendrothele bispora CBS 962.96]THV05909.1 hypothetical protein K435DRAFT_62420 [Dendrothele bispora CBS 962.96]
MSSLSPSISANSPSPGILRKCSPHCRTKSNVERRYIEIDHTVSSCPNRREH